MADTIIDLQIQKFAELGLSYDNGFSLSNKIHENLNMPKISSQHRILFSSISLIKNVRSILEIGTFKAKNAKFLSALFPDAVVTTLDLDSNDTLFKNTYKRDNEEYRIKFIEDRDAILQSSKNIKFVEQNSIKFLFNTRNKFDLIWIDGAHGYPSATIDVAYSLKTLNKNGYIICDDVYKNIKESDKIYQSIASLETLKSFLDAKIIKQFDLIFKRLNGEEKFIAVVQEKNII